MNSCPRELRLRKWGKPGIGQAWLNAETQRFAEKRREKALSEGIWRRGGCGKE
jgi:hypothetical protein